MHPETAKRALAYKKRMRNQRTLLTVVGAATIFCYALTGLVCVETHALAGFLGGTMFLLGLIALGG